MSDAAVCSSEGWIDLPLQGLTKSELREQGVPQDLIAAVRSARSVADLEALPLPAQVFRRVATTLVQTRAGARYRAFNEAHRSDLAQGLVDLLVTLDDRQQAMVDRVAEGGFARIRGVAGSGKTQVLLHAIAKRLYRAPAATDLFWSYNRTLGDMARAMVNRLAGPRAQHLTLETFDGWCKRYLGETRQIKREDDLRSLVATAREHARKASWDSTHKIWERDLEFWREEFDFIRDQPVESLSDYLEVERVGRGTRLDRGQRALVWLTLEQYMRVLDTHSVRDWRQVRLDAYRRLRGRPERLFEQVFIDEAQDLPPIAFRLASLLSCNNVTLTLDGAQAIYRKGFRWRDLGAPTSRTVTLTTCYRTTGSISRMVVPFRATEDDPLATSTVREGRKPRAVKVLGGYREADWVVEDIRRRLERGESPGHIAVLAYTRRLTKAVAHTLEDAGIQVSKSTDGCLDFSDATVKVATINSAKGLEFPVVYIAPLWDDDFFPRKGDPDERELEAERRRKVLYVALTRARDELILVHRRDKASRILHEIPATTLEHEEVTVGAAPADA